MSLQAWMARAAALGKKIPGALEDAVRGKERLQLGMPPGFDMARVGGLLGQRGAVSKLGAGAGMAASKLNDGLGAAGQKLGAGADALEQFIQSHPNLVAGGAGLLGGGLGGAGYLASQGGGDDEEAELEHRHRGRGMQ